MTTTSNVVQPAFAFLSVATKIKMFLFVSPCPMKKSQVQPLSLSLAFFVANFAHVNDIYFSRKSHSWFFLSVFELEMALAWPPTKCYNKKRVKKASLSHAQ